MKPQEYKINGKDYWVDEFPRGFAWVGNGTESTEGFPTALEALQDAINYAQLDMDYQQRLYEQMLEDREHGSFEEQRQAVYRGMVKL